MVTWRTDAFQFSPEEMQPGLRNLHEAKVWADTLWHDPRTQTRIAGMTGMAAYVFRLANGCFYYAVTSDDGAQQYAAMYEMRIVAKYQGEGWIDVSA